MIKQCRKIKPRLSHEVDINFVRDLADMVYDRYSELGLKPLIRTFDAIMRIAAGLAKLTFSNKIRKWHVETAYKLITSQLEKVKLNIPTVPPYILDVNPTRGSLKEMIWKLIVEECNEHECDKETLLLKFKDYVNKLIEIGELSKYDIDKITGGSLTTFFEQTIDELTEKGVIIKPTTGKIKVIK